MSNEQRFFFIYSNSIIFPLTFIFGMLIVPLTCGIRYLCVRLSARKEPVKPTDPDKPEKPREPPIGASSETWNTYREDLAEYRKKRDQWKEDSRKFAENKNRLLKEYDNEQKKHSEEVKRYKAEVLIPAKELFCNTFLVSTTSVLFCKKDTPELIKKLLKSY